MRRPRRAYLIAGGLLVGAIFCLIFFADYVTKVSPHYYDAKTSILLGIPPFPPDDAKHLLGTDAYGRDVWSRLVYGARWSMLFAFLITAARLSAALPAAFLSVFGWKRLGWLVDRLYVMTSAIPPLLIYILVLGVPQLRLIGLWPSVAVTVTVLTLMEWPRVAVVLKGRLNSLMAEPFVEGAIAVGNTRWQLFKNHLFPHIWPLLLQLVTAEMSRALVVIAQLAIFGIMVGGGVMNIVDDGRGGDKYVVTSGIPEWGTLLSEGRYDVLTHPWIPFSPAVAFLVGIVGFNLLSQGLETMIFSVQQIKEKTTARLSARWRWLIPVAIAAVTLWYYQGLPWTRTAGIVDLAARQSAALTARDLDAYTATLRSEVPLAEEDMRRWAAELLKGDVQIISLTPVSVKLSGRTATALWRLTVGWRGASPLVLTRETKLVRHLGRWYESGDNYQMINGYHVDLAAVYNPVDPETKAITARWNVQFLATAADHAYESVADLFPAVSEAPRPLIKLFPDFKTLQETVGGALPPGEMIWYEPGTPIRMAPDYLRGSKRWDVERSLAFEMMKFLTETRLGQDKVSPLTIGAWDLRYEKERDSYRIYTDRLAGYPFFALDELFNLPLARLSHQRQYVFVTQAALLAEFAESRLAERPVLAVTPAELAAKLGMAPEALAREYDAYVFERVMSESLLNIPAAKPRIPAGLAEAVAATSVKADGLVSYEAQLVDFTEGKNGAVTVLVMERAAFADGHVVRGIVSQTWQRQGDGWVQWGDVKSLLSK